MYALCDVKAEAVGRVRAVVSRGRGHVHPACLRQHPRSDPLIGRRLGDGIGRPVAVET